MKMQAVQKEVAQGDIFHIASQKNQFIFKLILFSSLAKKDDLIPVAR